MAVPTKKGRPVNMVFTGLPKIFSTRGRTRIMQCAIFEVISKIVCFINVVKRLQ